MKWKRSQHISHTFPTKAIVSLLQENTMEIMETFSTIRGGLDDINTIYITITIKELKESSVKVYCSIIFIIIIQTCKAFNQMRLVHHNFIFRLKCLLRINEMDGDFFTSCNILTSQYSKASWFYLQVTGDRNFTLSFIKQDTMYTTYLAIFSSTIR